MKHDHTAVILAPAHRGEDGRRFYETLGFVELSHGAGALGHGAWLAHGDVRIHLHAAADGAPLEPVELTIAVDDPTAVAECCWNAGYSVRVEQPSPERMRLYVIDPFGNRVELVGPASVDELGAERCA